MFCGLTKSKSLFLVQMLLSLLSRKGSVRLVRAFTQTASSSSSRRSVAALGPPGLPRSFASSTGQAASVEEDLDVALSDFLEDSSKVKRTEFADLIPTKELAAKFERASLEDLLEEDKVSETDVLKISLQYYLDFADPYICLLSYVTFFPLERTGSGLQ